MDGSTNQQAKKRKDRKAKSSKEDLSTVAMDENREYISVAQALEAIEEKEKAGSGKVSTSSKSKDKEKVPQLERKKVNYKEKSDCLENASEQCEIITMAEKQLMDTRIEYGAVTSYLTDIQKIDRIPKDSKEKLMDSARRVLTLTQERSRFQNREVKISDIMYKHLEKYEDIVPNEIVKMKKNEEYELLIKKDLESLEGEKAVLLYEKEELEQKKSYVRCISIISCLLLVLLFIMFAVFQSQSKMEVTMPVLLTVFVGIVVVFLLFVENNKTNTAICLNERKLNKAIGLTNKVKIKYINNRNNLDYTYQKFRVHAAKEFAYLWEQYVKVKDETKRYQQNTELLEYYNRVLVEELKSYDVEDSEVWIYQPLALIDEKEMVEVRHRLNNRRQKLREQIDYNNELIASGRAEIQKILEQSPNLKEQIEELLREHQMELK